MSFVLSLDLFAIIADFFFFFLVAVLSLFPNSLFDLQAAKRQCHSTGALQMTNFKDDQLSDRKHKLLFSSAKKGSESSQLGACRDKSRFQISNTDTRGKLLFCALSLSLSLSLSLCVAVMQRYGPKRIKIQFSSQETTALADSIIPYQASRVLILSLLLI